MQVRNGRAAKKSRAHLNAFEAYCDVYVAAGVDELSLCAGNSAEMSEYLARQEHATNVHFVL